MKKHLDTAYSLVYNTGMRTDIEKIWAKYRDVTVPIAASAEQVENAKQSFYAGAREALIYMFYLSSQDQGQEKILDALALTMDTLETHLFGKPVWREEAVTGPPQT